MFTFLHEQKTNQNGPTVLLLPLLLPLIVFKPRPPHLDHEIRLSNESVSLCDQALRFTGTTNTIVRKITSINSKQFHLNFDTCNNVLVDGVTIEAPGDSPNTDGIHMAESSNVIIRNIVVGTGDFC